MNLVFFSWGLLQAGEVRMNKRIGNIIIIIDFCNATVELLPWLIFVPCLEL
jgi:hypothetical protein